MTDDEIRALRAAFDTLLVGQASRANVLALADEALRRGEEIARLRKVVAELEDEDEAERVAHFKEHWQEAKTRIVRLEAALRSLMDGAAERIPDANTWWPLMQARAALEEKP